MLQFPIELLLYYSVGETIQSLLIQQKTSPKSLWLSAALPCCHYLTNHLYYTVGYSIINYSDAAADTNITTTTTTTSLPFGADNKFDMI